MIPQELRKALAPITVVVGHYGAGKTNFSVNVAIDLAAEGNKVTLIDLDIVNPYFRASEQRRVLEANGVTLVAPVFAEAGTSLDVPSLTGRIMPAIESAGKGNLVVIDAGGDDAGSIALGRYARAIEAREHTVLYLANRYRNLVQDIDDAVQNMAEIQMAARLGITGIVNNSHLQDATDEAVVSRGREYAVELSSKTGIPLVCSTAPLELCSSSVDKLYPVERYVKAPWEQSAYAEGKTRGSHGKDRS